MLLASYPNSTPSDEQGYIALVMGVFMRYPPDLVRKAVAPSGIPFEIIKWLPTVGEIEKWLKGWNDRVLAAYERDVRREQQITEREEWLAQPVTEAMKEKARAWLNRTDPIAQELSGQKPKALTEEQKKAALESAAKVGKEISGMRLLPETLTVTGLIDQSPSES